MSMDSSKIDHCGGEISAIMCFIVAVINTHPDIHALAKDFHRLSELQLSDALSRQVSEDYMQGQTVRHDDIKNHLFAALSKSV